MQNCSGIINSDLCPFDVEQ